MALPMKVLFLFCLHFLSDFFRSDSLPIVVNTWPFTKATQRAWEVVYSQNGSALDAVEAGCSKCEELQCDGTVGYGGGPDENGETTLDAMIMDGKTHNVGAVTALRRVKDAISVARAVMEYTEHTMLAGQFATDFALSMGFRESDLHTNKSRKLWKKWKEKNCQPNYRQNVTPDPKKNCGPYTPIRPSKRQRRWVEMDRSDKDIGYWNHDTIGMLVVDASGNIAGGTSTNGLKHKVPGRVADSPIVGAGAYVDNDVGGAAATGDGDIMMRFLPSHKAVELMRQGDSPAEAAEKAIRQIIRKYPTFSGALIAMTVKGQYGAACHNINRGFRYSVRGPSQEEVKVVRIPCV